MDDFIRDWNISSYVERLHTEGDGPTRRTLQKLLIAEEDKFGRLTEKIATLDRWIEDGEKRTGRLEDLLSSAASANGHVLLERSSDLIALLRMLRAKAHQQMKDHAARMH